MRYLFTVLLAACLIAPLSAHAQHDGAEPSNGATSPDARHRITLGFGLLPQIEVSSLGSRLIGYVGSLAYANRIRSSWEVEFSGSLHNAEATLTEAASLTSLLIGANYYPAVLAPSRAIRPYLSGAVGPYVGSSVSSIMTRTRIETVVGARLGVGLHVRLGRWVHGGLRGAYHATPNYTEPVGRITSTRGLQLSLEAGVTFGGR